MSAFQPGDPIRITFSGPDHGRTGTVVRASDVADGYYVALWGNSTEVYYGTHALEKHEAARIVNHDTRIPLYSQADREQTAARTRGAMHWAKSIPGQLWSRLEDQDAKTTRKPLKTFRVVDSVHPDCGECMALVGHAETYASAMGSTGATYGVHHEDVEHGVTVKRNYALTKGA